MLSQKYLQQKSDWQRPGTAATVLTQSETVVNVGYIDATLVAVGVYYCSDMNKFGCVEGSVQDQIIDPLHRIWRLVTGSHVNWMEQKLRGAFDNPDVLDDDLSRAITKYHAVRDRLLEECGVSLAEVYQGSPVGRAGRPAEDSNGDHTLAGEGREGEVAGAKGASGAKASAETAETRAEIRKQDAPVRSAG